MVDNEDIRTGRQAIWDLHVHLVFVTKYRRDVFKNDMLTTCENVMRDVCKNFGATLEEFNGGPDHVHLLVRYPATVAVSKLVNSLKGVSSRVLRRDYADEIAPYLWGGHLWSRSYYASSAGGAPLSAVAEYVMSQACIEGRIKSLPQKGEALHG